MDIDPSMLSQHQTAEFVRKRRGRNLALLVVLAGLAVLFYAISIVKLMHA